MLSVVACLLFCLLVDVCLFGLFVLFAFVERSFKASRVQEALAGAKAAYIDDCPTPISSVLLRFE